MLRAFACCAVALAVLAPTGAAADSVGVVAFESGRATAAEADTAQRAATALGTAAGPNRTWTVMEGAVGVARTCREPACLGALGRERGQAFVLAIGVDRGAAATAPLTVSLRLVDATQDRDLGMAQVDVPPGTADWSAVLASSFEPLLRQLPVAAPPTGTLLVTADVPSAAVFVDGRHLGSVPMEPASLPVGGHQLRVASDRYSDFLQEVRVEPGRETRVDATLVPLPAPAPVADDRPLYRRPWVWGVAGAVVVTGVVVAVVLATSGGEESSVPNGAIPIPPLR